MAIRDKIKAKFGKNKNSSGDSTPTGPTPPEYFMGRKDIEYYKPHEIPKSKYRGRVDKDHQEKLDSFSFGDAFQTMQRRASTALSGTFSPGGTQALSRAASFRGSSARSSVSSTTNRTLPSNSSYSDGTHSRRSAAIAPSSHVDGISSVTENSDDDTDVANTGLSRVGTIKRGVDVSNNLPDTELDRTATVTDKNIDQVMFDRPFTAEELERAMTKVTIKGNHDSPLRSEIMV